MRLALLILLFPLSLLGQSLSHTAAYRGAATSRAAPGDGSVPVDLLWNFNGQTAGVLVTTNIFGTARVGSQLGSVDFTGGSVTNHCFISNISYTLPFPLSVGGVLFSNVTKELVFNAGPSDTAEMFQWVPDGISPIFGISAMLVLRIVSTSDANYDIPNIAAGNFGVAQWQVTSGGANVQIVAHREPGTANAITGILTNHLYREYIRVSYAEQKVEVAIVDANTGLLVGSSSKPDGDPYLSLNYILFQDYLTTGSSRIEMSMMALDWTNKKFPLENITIPAPTNVYVVQTATNTIRLLWTGSGVTVRIERDAGSGFSTVTNGYTAFFNETHQKEFNDTNLTEGVTYTYRITSEVGDLTSTPVTSAGILVTNSHPGFDTVWQQQVLEFQSFAVDTQIPTAAFPAAIEQHIKGINTSTVLVSQVDFKFSSVNETTVTNGEKLSVSFYSQTNHQGVHYGTSPGVGITTNIGWKSFAFFTPVALPPGSNCFVSLEGTWPKTEMVVMSDFIGSGSYFTGEGFNFWYNGADNTGGDPYDMVFKIYVKYTPVPPIPLTITQTASNQVTLTWDDSPNGGLVSYKLDLKTNNGIYTVPYTNSSQGATSLVVNGLSDGKTNFFRIYGYISGAAGSESATTNFPSIVIDNSPYAAPTFTDSLAGASTDTSDSNSAAWQQSVVCGTTGHCTKLRVWCRTFNFAASVKLALYDNSNNLLGNAEAVSISPSAGSWVTVTISPVSVTSGTTYKIGALTSSSGIQIGYLAGVGTVGEDFTSYASFPPNPWAPSTFSRTVAAGMGVVP